MIAIMLLIVFFVSAMNFAASQDEYTCSGFVRDENNDNGISGARIVLENSDNSAQRYEVYSENNGYYSNSLPGGTYTITISADGYETQVLNRVYIDHDSNEDIYLIPSNDGGGYSGPSGDGDPNYNPDGDGDGDDDGDDDGDNQSIDNFIPLGLEENGAMYMSVCFGSVFLILILFILMACACLGTFVRLGKIKKDIKKLSENQPQQRPQQQQYQNDYNYGPPPGPESHPPPRRDRDYGYDNPPPAQERPRQRDERYDRPPPEREPRRRAERDYDRDQPPPAPPAAQQPRK